MKTKHVHCPLKVCNDISGLHRAAGRLFHRDGRSCRSRLSQWTWLHSVVYRGWPHKHLCPTMQFAIIIINNDNKINELCVVIHSSAWQQHAVHRVNKNRATKNKLLMAIMVEVTRVVLETVLATVAVTTAVVVSHILKVSTAHIPPNTTMYTSPNTQSLK